MAKSVAGDERAELQCELASALNSDAILLQEMDRPRDALAAMGRANELYEVALGAEHHFVGIGQHNMGLIHISLGDTAAPSRASSALSASASTRSGCSIPTRAPRSPCCASCSTSPPKASPPTRAPRRSASSNAPEEGCAWRRPSAAGSSGARRRLAAGGGPGRSRRRRRGGGRASAAASLMPTRPSFSKQQQLGRAPGLPGLRRGMSWSKAGGGGVASFSRRDSWSRTRR